MRKLILANLALSLMAGSALGQVSNDVVKIGVLSDFQSNYAEVGGKGAVTAVQMAIEDFGKTVLGKPIELVIGDHANKPDNGSAIARRWFDELGVDMIIDLPNSPVALAVQNIGKEKGRIVIHSAGATEALTGAACSPTGINWNYDSYAVGKALAMTLARKDSRWFFLTIDTAGGTALQQAATSFIEAAGGKVVGSVRHPLASNDMASFLLQAQSSGAQYVAMGSAGTDLVNAIKQAAEFGLREKQQMVTIVMFMSDVRALGLEAGQGLTFITAFHPSSSPEAEAWSKRFIERTGHVPNDVQASDYSATMHYLTAIREAGTDDPAKVMAKMREMPVNDMFAKNGKLRPDGRMVHDMYLVRIKSPKESTGPHDLVHLVQTIPGDEAFRPLAESACPLLKK